MGEWETTKELPKVTGIDDSVTYVIKAHENDLLEKPSWKHPKTYEQALGLDKQNSDTLWGDAITMIELTQAD
jgi:hypothetical protein